MFFRLQLYIAGFLICANSFAATYDFSYSGRLVDNTGRPLDGPVALKASFFHSETGATSILDVTSGLTQVPLSEGVFQIKLSLSDSDFQRVFPGVNQSVYIQITDLTHSSNQPYDRQQLTILPYAGKIPIDTSQFSWDSLGQLRFTASTTADFSSAGPIGSTTPNTAIFTTVTTNRTSSATSGSVVNVTISPTYNQASGTAANTDLLINRTETAVGSGTQRLIDAQVGGTTMFNVSNAGNGYFGGNVGIGTTSPAATLNTVNSSSSLSYASIIENLHVSNSQIVTKFISRSTAAVNSFGMLNGYRATNTANSGNGFHFSLDNSANAEKEYGGIGVGIESNTAGAEGGFITLQTTSAGTTRQDRMRITAAGNVGIGTASPITRLSNSSAAVTDASGVSGTGSSLSWVSSTGGGYAAAISNSSSVAGRNGLLVKTSQNDSSTFILKLESGGVNQVSARADGNFGIGNTNPSQKLAVGASGDGSVAIANSWTTYSDKRLKKNVSVIDNALEKISKITGVFFNWKKGDDSSRQIGVMAQDVEKIFPELVKEGSDGIKSVDYPKLVAPMIEAVKSLKSKVERLTKENIAMKQDNDVLKHDNTALKEGLFSIREYLCKKEPDASICKGQP
ncbi:MAG: tail fiber domain-containing protein [Proteobacteria bacterium]|nr:tail fiber domain-containing protein [Pseudomonadota bacterium]